MMCLHHLSTASCVYSYTRITYFSYECKLQLAAAERAKPVKKEDDDAGGQSFLCSSYHDATVSAAAEEVEVKRVKDVVSLMDRKLTRVSFARFQKDKN